MASTGDKYVDDYLIDDYEWELIYCSPPLSPVTMAANQPPDPNPMPAAGTSTPGGIIVPYWFGAPAPTAAPTTPLEEPAKPEILDFNGFRKHEEDMALHLIEQATPAVRAIIYRQLNASGYRMDTIDAEIRKHLKAGYKALKG